jgi:hypothetical protein
LGHKAALLQVMGMALAFTMITSGCGQMQPGSTDPGQTSSPEDAAKLQMCMASKTMLAMEKDGLNGQLNQCKADLSMAKLEGCAPMRQSFQTVQGKDGKPVIQSVRMFSCRQFTGAMNEYPKVRFVQEPKHVNSDPPNCTITLMKVNDDGTLEPHDYCSALPLVSQDTTGFICTNFRCTENEGTNLVDENTNLVAASMERLRQKYGTTWINYAGQTAATLINNSETRPSRAARFSACARDEVK